MQGTRSRSPESRLDGVQEELAGTTQELHDLEQELHKNSTNAFLLKKYERLTRREQLLLEERKLWAGAALQNHSWQAGLHAAPGVKALLQRLVLASGLQGAEADIPPEVRRAITASQISQPAPDDLPRSGKAGRRGYGGRRVTMQPSPDKAQLMLLANAADAAGPDGLPSAFEHMMPGLASERVEAAAHAPQSSMSKRQLDRPGIPLPVSKRRAFGSGLKTFHVAKTGLNAEEAREEGPPIEVPVALSMEDKLAEYARAILAGDAPYRMVLNEGRAHSKQHEIAACVPTENLQAAKAHSSRQGPQNEPADSEPRASVEPEQVTAQQSQLGGAPGNSPADEAAKEPETGSGPSAAHASPAASNSVGGANGGALLPKGIAAEQNGPPAAVLPEQALECSAAEAGLRLEGSKSVLAAMEADEAVGRSKIAGPSHRSTVQAT